MTHQLSIGPVLWTSAYREFIEPFAAIQHALSTLAGGVKRQRLFYDRIMSAPQYDGWQEALKRIENAERSNAWSLDLSDLELTTIPESVGQLTNLQKLKLSGNQISTIPDFIAQLTNLQSLNLRNNQVAVIPASIAQLAGLQELNLHSNKIAVIPESIAQLANLRILYLGINEIKEIPDFLAKLTNLQKLELGTNQISRIPNSLAQLTKLQNLYLHFNRITTIPDSFVQLANLRALGISGNPLPDELLAAASGGVERLFRYLRSTATHQACPRTVKLILLGEPKSGKTTLLEALKGNPQPCDPGRQETIGIDVITIAKPHPTDQQSMYISVWDFAGQHIEHATHQFFLT